MTDEVTDESKHLRERIAKALYAHEPLYQRHPVNPEQKRSWLNLWTGEQAPFLARADAVLDALGLELEGGSSEPSAADPEVWHAYNVYRLRALEATESGRKEQ